MTAFQTPADPTRETAIVLFSGGQDSATCLAWALSRFGRVETLGFDYGQRHAVELACRAALRTGMAGLNPDWATRLGQDHTLALDALGAVSETALTRDAAITMGENGLPSTFVPGRNLIFLTFAAALAARRGARHIVGGMCETDYSGYPDCRDDTIKALQVALNLGMDSRYVLHTPLMWIDKADTWRLAESLGGPALVDLINRESHSCYLGVRDVMHPWGHGCGTCPACMLRRAGWERYVAQPAIHPATGSGTGFANA
ncbi:7-cyano-7-deazaguanine synthase QueC [Nguyenibacter sp. L1]|uniref:7-cyano-7-deazaguanine synthase QueC n=1 Tax=Nguyenibacter sp. L1 TaxID=3049350 RepID=UPI002B48B8A7|nr:7-cyano-7-deazaguanine synthase QueC [Nguyenibacter sp. L1]WRH87971.1 7-cyano-7-deazaguanine synthase QueC [Nguyenibacter sp. L1]